MQSEEGKEKVRCSNEQEEEKKYGRASINIEGSRRGGGLHREGGNGKEEKGGGYFTIQKR